jgi:hypothetical protein
MTTMKAFITRHPVATHFAAIAVASRGQLSRQPLQRRAA